MSLLQRTIAFTGASGLVGAGVVGQSLLEDHRVIAIDTAPTSFLPAEEQEKPGKRYADKQVDCMKYEAFREAVRVADGLIHFGSGVVYNTNSAMSHNALLLSPELGIDRVSLATSVNSIRRHKPREDDS